MYLLFYPHRENACFHTKSYHKMFSLAVDESYACVSQCLVVRTKTNTSSYKINTIGLTLAAAYIRREHVVYKWYKI